MATTKCDSCEVIDSLKALIGGRTRHICSPRGQTSGVGVGLKEGINIEKSEGVGSGGCSLPSWRSGGLPQKSGGLSPVLKVGDLPPCPPCSDAYGPNSGQRSSSSHRLSIK